MARAALDTSVIIEYIDKAGDLHEQARAIFSAILAGKLEAIIPHPILAETYYVAVRIYRELDVKEPEVIASKLIGWLYRLPMIKIIGESLELAVEVGRVKVNYNLALTDCYVLATSKICGCKAVFKKPEREMLRKIDSLRAEYQLIFLEDYR